jgi:hypothetical protein
LSGQDANDAAVKVDHCCDRFCVAVGEGGKIIARHLMERAIVLPVAIDP